MPMKHVHEKENKKKFDCKRKVTLFYLLFSSIATLRKPKHDLLCQLFLELISILVNAMYF